jgi:ADP-heptose:LPS heptosyltransferase
MKHQKYDSTRGRKSLKFFDRYLGIPIIAVLGLFYRRRKMPQDFKHFGLMKTGAIGDTVLLLGVLESVRSTYPVAKISVFLGSSNASMAIFMPGINVVTIPVTNPLKSIKLIRQEQCDVLIDFGQWPRLDSILSFFSNSHFTVGFNTARQYRSSVYDLPIKHDNSLHEYSNFKNLIKSINVDLSTNPLICLGRERQPNGAVAIHMFPGGSRADLRIWPHERWIELVNHLIGRGLQVILTGAKSDVTQAEDLKAQVKVPNRVFVKAGVSLKETCDVLYDSEVVISVDTGVMHIAAALGCNIVSLHAPAPISRWGPLSDKAISLDPSQECLGCSYLGFEPCIKNRQCINDITVDRVIRAVEKFLPLEETNFVFGMAGEQE